MGICCGVESKTVITEKLKEGSWWTRRPPAAYAKQHVDGAVNALEHGTPMTTTGRPRTRARRSCHRAVGGEAMMTIKTLKKRANHVQRALHRAGRE